MKRFETPSLKVEKFDFINIITTSGDTPVEPAKEDAVEAAKAALQSAGITAGTFEITL